MDHSATCCTECTITGVQGKDLLRNGRNIGLHDAAFPIREDPKSTLFGMVHYIISLKNLQSQGSNMKFSAKNLTKLQINGLLRQS